MNKSMPVIGITSWYNYEKRMLFIKGGYCEGVIEVGGLPIMLPLTEDKDLLDQIIDTCDGFLISGGPDVDAKHYGEENLPFNEEISPIRDIVELYIAKRAIELNKPVLGICRGIQVINVTLGGTLYQDIHSQIRERILLKHSQSAPKWYPTHNISIEKGTRVWNTCKSEVLSVNSFHHQAVKDVAPGLIVAAKATDGIIEAVEYTNHRFVVGVQWHPELMWQANREFLNLFRDFVNSCK